MILSEEERNKITNQIIDMMNVRTTIVSSTIRSNVSEEKAKVILRRIDYLCSKEYVRNEVYNKLELNRVGKRRRI